MADSGGLYLLVKPTGGKLWRFDYRFGGKRKTLSLGQYPTTSLAAARRSRDNAKEQLEQGNDPSEKRKLEKLAIDIAANNTFRFVADEWLRKTENEGRAKRTLAKNRWLLAVLSGL